jgi:hypothetical protein
MTALTASRATPHRVVHTRVRPVGAGQKIFAGALVAINATGFAVKGVTALNLKGFGTAEATVDNTGGADGALSVAVRRGAWQFANSAAGDQITAADIGSACYIVDDQTVAKTNGGGTRSNAGTVADVDANGVWVEFA